MESPRADHEQEAPSGVAGGSSAHTTPRGLVGMVAAYGAALATWGVGVAGGVGWLWAWRWPSPLGDWPWIPSLVAGIVAVSVVVAGTVWRARALLRGDGSALALWAGGEALTAWPAFGGPAPALDELDGRLLEVAGEVSRSFGLPRGKLFLLRGESALNAFAAGWAPSTSAIAVTRGALDVLGREELRALLAQLYAHVKRGDARLQMAAVSLVWGFAWPRVVGEQRRRPDPEGSPAPVLDQMLGITLVVLGAPMMHLAHWLQQRAASDLEWQADAAAARDAPSLRVPLAAVLQKAWYQHERGTDRLQSPRLQALASMLLACPPAGLRRPGSWSERLRRLTGQALEPLPCELLTPLAVDPPIAAEQPVPSVPPTWSSTGLHGLTGETAGDGRPAPVAPPAASAGGDLAARMSAVAASLAAPSSDAGPGAEDLARVLGTSSGALPSAPSTGPAPTERVAAPLPDATTAAAAASTLGAGPVPVPAQATPTRPPAGVPDPEAAVAARWRPLGARLDDATAVARTGSLQEPVPSPVPEPPVSPVSPVAAAWAAARAGRAMGSGAVAAAADRRAVGAVPGSAAGSGLRAGRFSILPPVPPPGSPEALEIERLAGLALSGGEPLAGLPAPGALGGGRPDRSPSAAVPGTSRDRAGADSGSAPLDDGASGAGPATGRRRHRWRRPRPYADSLLPPIAARSRGPAADAAPQAGDRVAGPAPAAPSASSVDPANAAAPVAARVPTEPAQQMARSASASAPDASPPAAAGRSPLDRPAGDTAVARSIPQASGREEPPPPVLALPALDMPALDRDLAWAASPAPAAVDLELDTPHPAAAVDVDLGGSTGVDLDVGAPSSPLAARPVAATPALRLTPLPEVTELGDLPVDIGAPTPRLAGGPRPPPGTGLDLGADDVQPPVEPASEGDEAPAPRAPGLPAGLAPPVGARAQSSAAPMVLREISGWLDATRSQPSRGRRPDEPTSAWPPLGDSGAGTASVTPASPALPEAARPAVRPASASARADVRSPVIPRSGVDAAVTEARERLSRLHGPGELRAAVLAFMVSPGSDRDVRAWRAESESYARAAQVFADLNLLPPEARLPWFGELVRRASLGALEDRRALAEAARRVMTATGVVKPLDRLRWLALRHGLGHAQKRAVVTPVAPSPSGELAFFASNRRPIATYTAFLARLVPLYSSDVGIDPLGARWYDAVMQRFFGAQDVPAAQVPDSDALVHALWTLQTMPWMSRPPLIRAWVGEAVAHSGPRGLAREAADALYLTCMMLDSPMPPDLAKSFAELNLPPPVGG
jgi:Zn-dependent protease with chaperone function